MNKRDKDKVCDLWLEVFGVQEGVGRNCPAGAYEFADLVIKMMKEKDARKNSRSRASKEG